MSKRLDILLRLQKGLDKSIRDGAGMQGVPEDDKPILAETMEKLYTCRAQVAVMKAKITSEEDF
jgi:hypothetical protein